MQFPYARMLFGGGRPRERSTAQLSTLFEPCNSMTYRTFRTVRKNHTNNPVNTARSNFPLFCTLRVATSYFPELKRSSERSGTRENFQINVGEPTQIKIWRTPLREFLCCVHDGSQLLNTIKCRKHRSHLRNLVSNRSLTAITQGATKLVSITGTSPSPESLGS